jgi:hypothetical protein
VEAWALAKTKGEQMKPMRYAVLAVAVWCAQLACVQVVGAQEQGSDLGTGRERGLDAGRRTGRQAGFDRRDEERFLFPKNFVRGYVDFQVAPSHNEPDLGRCSGPNPAGAQSLCTAFARYVWSGYTEIQPFGRTILKNLFLFIEPKFFGGNNVPQFKYTASSAPIAFERAIGVGVKLTRNFELRLTQHRVSWLGRYEDVPKLGAADLGSNGPYGLYSTVAVRWYYGGWGGAPAH